MHLAPESRAIAALGLHAAWVARIRQALSEQHSVANGRFKS
ncbi:MAG: hypothetical protein OXT70_06580 [Chloroflexota bacterium]|nr:hypothetical protein [Chloroflexota bacterium]